MCVGEQNVYSSLLELLNCWHMIFWVQWNIKTKFLVIGPVHGSAQVVLQVIVLKGIATYI